MRSLVRLIGLLVLPALLFACGSSGNGGNKPPSAAQLQSKLLNASDVTDSWRAGQPINGEDLAAFAQLPCEAGTISPATVQRLTAVTGVQFEPADGSSRHLIELVVTGNATQLSADLRALFAAIESCSETTGSLALTKLTMPKLGDQQAAYAITQPGPASSSRALNLRSGYVRLGMVAVVVGLADFQATAQGSSRISDDAYGRLLKSAVAKLST